MFRSSPIRSSHGGSRRDSRRTLSTLVGLTLVVGTAGLTATAASAASGPGSEPQNVTVSWVDETHLSVGFDAPTVLGTGPHEYAVTIHGFDPATEEETTASDSLVYTPGHHTVAFTGQSHDSSYSALVWLDDLDEGGGDIAEADTPAWPKAVSEITGVSHGDNVTVTWTDGDFMYPVDSYDVSLDGGTPVTVDASQDHEATLATAGPGTYPVEVVARNASGTASASGEVTVDGLDVPGAATHVVASDYSNNAIQVTWDAPLDNGGLPIEYYEVSLTNTDTDEGLIRNQPIDWDTHWVFFETDDVVPVGDEYVVTVVAVNERGASTTVSTPAQIKVGSTVATSPRNLTATSKTNNQVTVAWDAPLANGGQPVTDYIVTVDDSTVEFEDSTAFVPGTDRTVTLTNIKAGTFGVTVTAYNNNGESAAATSSVTVANAAPVVVPPVVTNPPAAPPATAPAEPSAARSTAVKEGGVSTITWKAPVPINGAPVTRYLVTVDGRQIVVKKTATSLTVKGLRAGPAKILVRAENKYGVSSAAVTRIVVAKSVAQAPKATLKVGADSAAVKHLQVALGMRHHNGDFAKSTRAAVKRYQKANRMHRTGVVNDRLRYLLDV
jgi:hypothetical protein